MTIIMIIVIIIIMVMIMIIIRLAPTNQLRPISFRSISVLGGKKVNFFSTEVTSSKTLNSTT